MVKLNNFLGYRETQNDMIVDFFKKFQEEKEIIKMILNDGEKKKIFYHFLSIEIKILRSNIKNCLYDNGIISIILEQIKKEQNNIALKDTLDILLKNLDHFACYLKKLL